MGMSKYELCINCKNIKLLNICFILGLVLFTLKTEAFYYEYINTRSIYGRDTAVRNLNKQISLKLKEKEEMEKRRAQIQQAIMKNKSLSNMAKRRMDRHENDRLRELRKQLREEQKDLKEQLAQILKQYRKMTKFTQLIISSLSRYAFLPSITCSEG